MLQDAKRLVKESEGAVFAEFLIAFVPMWLFFLCSVQLALFAWASLVVKQAADCAARSAAVVLPDDPDEYDGEPKMSIRGARLAVIRSAASMPLASLASTVLGTTSKPSLRKAIGGAEESVVALASRTMAFDLSFPGFDAQGAAPKEITVRVTYAQPCAVPVARRLLCSRRGTIAPGEEHGRVPHSVWLAFSPGWFRTIERETTLMIQDAPYDYRPRGAV